MRLAGLALDGSSGGGVNQLVAAFAGDSSQNDLAAVASTVTASGGETPYTYAATLLDPRGVDRSAILTGGTTASPGFTPDLTGGGGVWTLRTTVTDAGGRTAVATKAVTVGQAGFVLARSIVSDGTTDASVSGGSIAWGGVTFAAPNAGVAVVDGDLVLTPPASTFFASGTRTAPLVSVSLTNLCGLTSLGDRQVLIVLDVESYTPAAAGEGLFAGLESSSNPIGSGGSGRGVAGGLTVSAGIRAASTMYSDALGFNSAANTTATIATIAGLACLYSGGSVIAYSATTAYADAAAVLGTAFRQNGGMRPSEAAVTLNQALIAAVKPNAGAGASCIIEGLQVWVR